MVTTREAVRDKLVDYFQRRMTLAELVDWAEDVMCDGDLDARDARLLRGVIARIGLADVRAFGLSWDDCYNFLAQLGYRVRVTVAPAVV